jgi:TPR repeat protein
MMAKGVRKNLRQAVECYRKAAEQGHIGAHTNLGLMYANGLGVPLDFAVAAKWYRTAADLGEPTAQDNLGELYAVGLGVPKDFVQAYMWNDLAAAGGQARATERRELLAAKMTSNEIADAQQRAREWDPAHLKP